jgi:hypothetical protein
MSNEGTSKGAAQIPTDERPVGYGKPPEQTRFKKGQSGNPAVARGGHVISKALSIANSIARSRSSKAARSARFAARKRSSRVL